MDDDDEVHGDNDNIDESRCRIASYDDDDDDDVDGELVMMMTMLLMKLIQLEMMYIGLRMIDHVCMDAKFDDFVSVMDGRTDGRTDRWTDIPACWDAIDALKDRSVDIPSKPTLNTALF